MTGTALAPIGEITALIERARQSLDSAKTAAEVMEAREEAALVYDAAKRAARLLEAKGAADEVIASARKMQADALEIEARAQQRIADEYDRAQEAGEVAGRQGGGERSGRERSQAAPTAAAVGLTRKVVHAARRVRDAENADPGIIRRTLDARLAAGQEPTRASVREAVLASHWEKQKAVIWEAACEGVARGKQREREKQEHYKELRARPDIMVSSKDLIEKLLPHITILEEQCTQNRASIPTIARVALAIRKHLDELTK